MMPRPKRMNFREVFHYISYLQYPLLLIGLYFASITHLVGAEELKKNPDFLFENLNSVLIFMGLGISFSSLQDTTKTQNKFSKKIWENPTKGKIAIVVISFMLLFFLLFGVIGYFQSDSGILKELSVGMIVLGLGMFGFLKAVIEMFENHRKDKNTMLNGDCQ